MKVRLKRVVINPLALMSVMKDDTAYRVTCGIPKSARLHGFTIDSQTQNLILFIEDNSFDFVYIQEDVAPLLTLEVRKVQ